MTYLWDNYIQSVHDIYSFVPYMTFVARLSSASRIILIGHGPGCQPLMELLDRRSASPPLPVSAYRLIFSAAAHIVKYVKVVIQIVGHSKIPLVPKRSEELRTWYYKVLIWVTI
jgi:histone deacetylase 6